MPEGTRIGLPAELTRRFLVQGAKLVGDLPPRSPRTVPPSRKIRVLAVVHGWFPSLAAGSERMVQHMLSALPREEFEVDVLSFGFGETDSTTESLYEYEGIPVHRGYSPVYEVDPDVIIFHHGPVARVMPSFYLEYPEAHVIAVYHNDRFDIQDIKDAKADLEVFNTREVKRSVGGPGIVVHPPLEPSRHFVEKTGSKILLSNIQKNKGVYQFAELARRMPEFEFLGLVGTHETQEFDLLRPIPNVEIHPVVQDMRVIWRKTRITLMPSGYESYGMIAAESCVSGIPVIASPTPGLIECLDHAGLFIPRDDVDGYEKTLRLLLTDENHYRERSSLAALRGRELEAQSQRELSRFVNRVRRMVRHAPSSEHH